MSLRFIGFQWVGSWAVDKLHLSHQILTNYWSINHYIRTCTSCLSVCRVIWQEFANYTSNDVLFVVCL